MATKKKNTAKEPEVKPEKKSSEKKTPFLKYLICGLLIFFLLPVAINGVRYIGGKAVSYYKYMLLPKKVIPDIMPDFKKDNGNRERRRGIDWTFSGSSYKEVGKWVAGNIPSGADKTTVAALAECFYHAADAIYDGETTTPGRSLAYLKKEILLAADEKWEGFFKGLTDQVADQKVQSMDDVASLYEDIGDGFSDAAKKLRTEGGGE